MTNSVLDISVQDIDHLGIVAGIIDALGVSRAKKPNYLELILKKSSALGKQSRAMILNGLGLVSAPLYLA